MICLINISLFNVPHYIRVICQVVDAIGALLKDIATAVRFCRSNLTKRRHHFRVKRCDWPPWVLTHYQHCFCLAVHQREASARELVQVGRVEFVKYLLQKCFSALRKFKSRFLDNIDRYVHLLETGNLQ